MKLLKEEAGCRASSRGNVSTAAVMGETQVEGLSDRGSIPLSSILNGVAALH